MTLKQKTSEPVYLFLPDHLIMEEPWKSYLEMSANFLKVQTPSGNGIQVFLDSEDIVDLASSLALKSCKRVLTLRKSPIS